MAAAAASPSPVRRARRRHAALRRPSWRRQVVRGVATGVGIAVLFAALTRSGYAVSIDSVDTGSMLPTLSCAATPGDPTCHGSASARFVVDHFTYHFRAPRDGEIVTFTLPRQAAALLTTRCGIPGDSGEYVKRVIATGGQTLTFKNGQVWRDGRKLTEPYLLDLHSTMVRTLLARSQAGSRRVRQLAHEQLGALQMTWLDNQRGQVVTIHVPRSTVYVMGDNRMASCDSRSFGSVPLRDVQGRVIQSTIAPLTRLSSMLAALRL